MGTSRGTSTGTIPGSVRYRAGCLACWGAAFVLAGSAIPVSGAGMPVVLTTAVPVASTNAVPGISTNASPVAASNDTKRLWFDVGEDLVYRIYWGVIPVGKTRVATRWIEEDGRRRLSIRFRTRSGKVLAALYPVDDIIESIIDPDTFLPVRFVKNLKEGRHRYHEITTFDYPKGVATWTSVLKNKTKTFDLPPDARDLVSFMYYMRSQRIPPGETRTYRVMADEKIYELIVHARDVEKEKFKRFGTVRSLRLEPEAKFEGLFVRKGKLTLWVSDDDRYILTRVDGKVPVASVHACIWEVRGPGDDFWIRQTVEKAGQDDDEHDEDIERALHELDE